MCPNNWFCLEKVKDTRITALHKVIAMLGESTPQYAGPASSVIPKATSHEISGERSYTGVSTRYAPNPKDMPHWYALRTTYGRERKAYDYITQHGCMAFLPTITIEKDIDGKKKLTEVSRLPNIFFAYGTEEAIKAFVYDNYNLPFLRFYYRHRHVGTRIEKEPLIVPDSQIRTLQIICSTKAGSDTLILTEEIQKFKSGEAVCVTEGNFKGAEGIVARFHGQQRVGIVITGLLTAVTAYIPSAFLRKKENK